MPLSVIQDRLKIATANPDNTLRFPPDLATRMKAIINILAEIEGGLKTLHDDLGVIHRDVSPGNIFLMGAHSHPRAAVRNLAKQILQAELGDYGLAQVSSPQNNSILRGGTPPYIAPEFYTSRAAQNYSPATDQASLAFVIYKLMSGHTFYEEMIVVPEDARFEDFVFVDPNPTTHRSPEEVYRDAVRKVERDLDELPELLKAQRGKIKDLDDKLIKDFQHVIDVVRSGIQLDPNSRMVPLRPLAPLSKSRELWNKLVNCWQSLLRI